MTHSTPGPAGIPMTPAVYHILLSLSQGDRHGYGIMQEVGDRTNGRERLGPGTLYRSIKRMRAAGLITAVEDPEMQAGDDDRRRYYRITDLGRRVVAEEARRFADLVAQAQKANVIDEPGVV
ncbi:MAG: PadR family transcriptional regulator [Planctomycetota bacterium]